MAEIDVKQMKTGQKMPGWTPPGKQKAKKSTKKRAKK